MLCTAVFEAPGPAVNGTSKSQDSAYRSIVSLCLEYFTTRVIYFRPTPCSKVLISCRCPLCYEKRPPVFNHSQAADCLCHHLQSVQRFPDITSAASRNPTPCLLSLRCSLCSACFMTFRTFSLVTIDQPFGEPFDWHRMCVAFLYIL